MERGLKTIGKLNVLPPYPLGIKPKHNQRKIQFNTGHMANDHIIRDSARTEVASIIQMIHLALK